MVKKGLGKGLGAIFGEDVIKETEAAHNKSVHKTEDTAADKAEEGKELNVKISLIQPNKEQPRSDFNQEQMNELAASIKQHGIIQPLLVQKKGAFYEIIAGERRWRAAKIAGLKEIPVIVREYSRQESMEISLIENVQREDLNPIEEAKAYQQLVQEFGLKQDEIAERVGKNRTTVANSLRLLKLDPEIQDMVIQGIITSGHSRALLALDDRELQMKAAKLIVDGGLNVRQTERLVKKLLKEAQGEEEKPKKEEKDLRFIYEDLEERMKTIMGTKVTIHNKDKNKGRIEIEYYSEAELERIVEMIESIHSK